MDEDVIGASVLRNGVPQEDAGGKATDLTVTSRFLCELPMAPN